MTQPSLLKGLFLLLLWAFPPSACVVVAALDVDDTSSNNNLRGGAEEEILVPKAAPAEYIPRSYASQNENHRMEEATKQAEVSSFFKFPVLRGRLWEKLSKTIPIGSAPANVVPVKLSPRQLGDLAPTIIPLIDNTLEGQRPTINGNIQPAITEPIPVGVSGTAPGGTLGSTGVPTCDGLTATFTYSLTEITGTRTTTSVANITTASFQGLGFSTDTCELKLSDSLIRFIGVGTLYQLPGSITCGTTPDCGLSEVYTINSQIANTFFIATAVIGFGGTLSGGISVTTLKLDIFKLTAGLATTTITGLDSGPFASVAPTIQANVETEVNNYLQGEFVTSLESEFVTAINNAFAQVTGIWAQDPPMIYLPQGLVADADVMPSRWEVARSWLQNLLGQQNWFGF